MVKDFSFRAGEIVRISSVTLEGVQLWQRTAYNNLIFNIYKKKTLIKKRRKCYSLEREPKVHIQQSS